MSIPGLPDPSLPPGLPKFTTSGQVGVVAAVVQLSLASLLIKPQRSIGPFTAHATVRETHNDTLQITDHPVEQGVQISDHAFMMPAEVVIEAMWSDSPASSIGSGIASGAAYSSAFTGNSPGQVTDLYRKLVELQGKRELFDVYTGKRVYRDMLLRVMSVQTDQHNEHVLKLTATCRHVQIARTQTLTVAAPASAQAQPGSTAETVNQGAKALQPAPHFHAGP